MKRYTLSGAAAATHTPEQPERTARRRSTRGLMCFDVVFQVWPSRAAMLLSLRMQDRRERDTLDWTACVKGAV